MSGSPEIPIVSVLVEAPVDDGLEHASSSSIIRVDDASVAAFLEFNHAALREAGYTHTVVPDRRVFVYSVVGAAIEVIWSRRSADETEIQRWATHFEVAKSEEGWRVVGIQATATDADSLDDVWPRDASSTEAGVG